VASKPNPIWHHPHGSHGLLKPGTEVVLTCRHLCYAASGDRWTPENEKDHAAVWKITSSNHSDYNLERLADGLSVWADFDHVREALPSDRKDHAEPKPAVHASMFDVMNIYTDGNQSRRLTKEEMRRG